MALTQVLFDLHFVEGLRIFAVYDGVTRSLVESHFDESASARG